MGEGDDDYEGRGGPPAPLRYQLERLREEQRRAQVLFWHVLAAAGGEVVIDAAALDMANPEAMSVRHTTGADGSIKIEALGGGWPASAAPVVAPEHRGRARRR